MSLFGCGLAFNSICKGKPPCHPPPTLGGSSPPPPPTLGALSPHTHTHYVSPPHYWERIGSVLCTVRTGWISSPPLPLLSPDNDLCHTEPAPAAAQRTLQTWQKFSAHWGQLSVTALVFQQTLTKLNTGLLFKAHERACANFTYTLGIYWFVFRTYTKNGNIIRWKVGWTHVLYFMYLSILFMFYLQSGNLPCSCPQKYSSLCHVIMSITIILGEP